MGVDPGAMLSDDHALLKEEEGIKGRPYDEDSPPPPPPPEAPLLPLLLVRSADIALLSEGKEEGSDPV